MTADSDQSQLFQLLDVLPVGVAVWSPGMRPYFANRAALEMLGRPSDGAPASGETVDSYEVQMEMRDLRVSGTDAPYPMGRDPFVRALDGETTHIDDVELGRPGDRRQFEVWSAPLLAPNGEVAFSVGAFTDITELKQAQLELRERTRELERLNDDLQRSNKDLEQFAYELQSFASTVAHDLKTPLTGVGSWAEILGDQLDDLDTLGVDVVDPRTSLVRIATSADRMEQLISDLLTYSQAQNAMPTPASVDLDKLVDAVANDLCTALTGPLPFIEHGPLDPVLADLPMVRQLLTNVIGNAVKYVAEGTTPNIVVASKVMGDMVEIRVSDNGIGIPPAERGLIFDSFYRAPGAGGYPGTGLGLAICARIVEHHGGRISAREGLDGSGTTLVFTLPADPGPVAEPTLAGVGDTTNTEPPPRRVGSTTAVS